MSNTHIDDVIEISSSEENATPVKKPSSPLKSVVKASPFTRIQGKRGPFAKGPTKRVVLDRVITVSSSSEDESEPEKPRAVAPTAPDTLLYSPVKASHTDVIDLALSSSEDDDDEENVAPRPKPVLKRLVKGSRPRPTPSVDNAPTESSLEEVEDILSGSYEDRELLSQEDDADLQDFIVPDSPGSSDSEAEEPAVLPMPRPKPRAKPTAKSPPPEPSASTSTSKTPQPLGSPTKNGKAPRVTKKALREAEQARRVKYAQKLFDELNASVFGGGLPKETKLTWSTRLLTTAGRAKWRRSRDGTQTTEIELATKVLDSDDRIRNTLSHEMCHLACWIINGDPKEGHGRAFKAWASKVTRKRPEITVSTRHNYEINYPYEWECDNCAKIYGRYSKSIRPEECRCGTCKTGKLVPLFKTRATTTSKAKTVSKPTATKSDGPNVVSSLLDSFIDLTVTPKTKSKGTGPSSSVAVDKLKALTEELQGLSPIDWAPVG